MAALIPTTTFTAGQFKDDEQYVIYGCLVALVDDIHTIAFNFTDAQASLAEALAEAATASGQSVMELVIRAHVDGIEDLVDFTEAQWQELERFKAELEALVNNH